VSSEQADHPLAEVTTGFVPFSIEDLSVASRAHPPLVDASLRSQCLAPFPL
jgi:hypothetical protein